MTAKSLNFTKLSIWCDSVRLHDTLFSLEGICHTGPADISLSTQRLDGTQMLERLDLKQENGSQAVCVVDPLHYVSYPQPNFLSKLSQTDSQINS